MRRLLVLCAMFACSVSLAQTEKIIVPSGVEMTLETYLDSKEEYVYTKSSSKVVMWSTKDQRQLYSFDAGKEIVLNHSGTKLVIDKNVFSTENGKLLFTLASEGQAAFSEDDKYIYFFSNYAVSLIDAATGAVLESLEHTNYLQKEDLFLTGSNRLLFVDAEGWQIWSIQPFALQQSFSFAGSNFEKPAVFNRKSNTLSVINLKYGKVAAEIYNASTGAISKRITDGNISEYSKLISSYDDGEIIIWNDKQSYLLADASTGTILKKGTSSYEFINSFSGLKKTVFADAGYDKKETGISMYKYSMADNKKGDSYRRSLMFVHDVTSLPDSNKVNINGQFVLNLTDLRPANRRQKIYDKATQATANGQYVITTNAGQNELYFTPVTDTVARSLNIVPAGKTFENDIYFIAADGSKIYYTASNKTDNANALYEYDVKLKKSTLLIPLKDIEGSYVNAGRRVVTYVENDYGMAKVFLKTYDVVDKKITSVKEIEDKKHVNDDIAAKQLFYKPGNQDNHFVNWSNYGSTITFYDIANNQETAINTGSEIYDYFLTADDKYLFTIQSDYSIPVWRVTGKKKLGTLYVFGNNDYVFVDEQGRFDGTPEGIKKLYYLKNRKVISLDLVYEKYYTPNLYQRLVSGENFPPMPDENLKQAPMVKMAYAEKQRNLEVSDDVPSYTNTTGLAEITVNASTEDDAIDEIRLFQNGKVLNLVTRNLIVEDDRSKTATKKYTVNLLPGNNEIRAIALNTQRTESQPDIIHVVYNNGASANTSVTPVVKNNTNITVDQIDQNATLHLVVVGINAYKNPKMSLNYALADATAFKEEVEKDAKSVIANVKTYFVTDNNADKTGISTAFTDVQKAAKPQDVFIFYYAGHGVIAEGNKEFYLVPNDVADLHNVDEALKQNGIAAKDLQQYAINIQAQKQLFILDACQSAGAFADMLSSDGNQQKNIALVARSTGTHWMAASGAQQFANEFSTLGHGAFTYVLLQALKGEAANNKMITVDGLKTYMQNGVPALMKKYNGSQQTPASYGFGNDFPVEIVK